MAKQETTAMDDQMTLSELIVAAKEDDTLTAMLHKLVETNRITGRRGTLNIAVKVEERNADTHELGIQFVPRLTLPQTAAVHTFYSRPGGNLDKLPEEDLFTGNDPERDA